MGFIELFLISVGLAADAFAVSVCKGLKMRRMNYRHAIIIALFFGGFQALMPFIGWLVGRQFEQYIEKYDHWVAFALLAFIGGKMIFEVIKELQEEKKARETDKADCVCGEVHESTGDRLDIKELFILAIATSIDALAVGITLALTPDVNIYYSIAMIGIITFILSALGVMIGNKFGAKYKAKAEILGGIILVLIGLKILLEGLGIINF